MAAYLGRQIFLRGCPTVRIPSSGNVQNLFAKCNRLKLAGRHLVRNAGDHGPEKMFIKPSSFQDWRAMRAIGFYMLLSGGPTLLFITIINIFVGEAKYSEIPEGYVPEYWEYHKHPITRFIAKHISPSPQQEYEKMAHFIEIEAQKIKERKIEKAVRNKMRERGDSPWFYSELHAPDLEE